MQWIGLVDDTTFLKELFGDSGPLLEAVRLHQVDFHQDGPRLTLRFDLATYPPNPPKKWVAAGYNTVQVELMAVGIHSVSLQGWAANNIGNMSIEHNGTAAVIQFRSDNCALVGSCDNLRVACIAGYRDTARSNPG